MGIVRCSYCLGYLNFDRARRQAKGDKGLQGVSDETIHNMLEETLTLATTIGAATAMGDGAEETLQQLMRCEHYYPDSVSAKEKNM